MNDKPTIRSLFEGEDAKRGASLERARDCAAFTKPWVCPPEAQTQSQKLPENYQSIGSRGIMNVAGKMVMALNPPGFPWMRRQVSPRMLYSDDASDDQKKAWSQLLWIQDLTMLALLNSTTLANGRHRRRAGFRTALRQSVDQILITGDVLQYLDKDYRLNVFPRSTYVVQRDSAGDILLIATKAKIDPLGLPDDMRAKAAFDRGWNEEPMAIDRMKDLFTLIEWQPQTKVWTITQEANDNAIFATDETINPYFVTPYELVPGENYGRSFVEQNLGDLRSLDNLREKMLDFAAACSKFLFGLDPGSATTDNDLQKPSGSIVSTKVEAGRWKDVAVLSVEKLADFSVVHQTAETIRSDLGVAFLIESESTPRADRIPRLLIERNVAEVQGMLGGLYAPIADDLQIPLLQRLVYQATRDKIIQPIPKLGEKDIEITALTGVEALEKERKKEVLLEYAQVVGQVSPEAAARIDWGVFAIAYQEMCNLYQPGLVKSDETIQLEQERQMQQALEAQAVQAQLGAPQNA